ncbi:hypothetical protein XENORESO_014268 [Xenotaenia resolanae]|uniref:Uncharacterized protein n=1 Tax=Xenotaenia resolanae TaxID=208358 RepID=A0ABV0W2V6_9TELE
MVVTVQCTWTDLRVFKNYFLHKFWVKRPTFTAKEIAETLKAEMSMHEERQKNTKRQFEYEGTGETLSTSEECFKKYFFLHLADTSIVTLRECFSNLQGFFELFIYSTKSLGSTG